MTYFLSYVLNEMRKGEGDPCIHFFGLDRGSQTPLELIWLRTYLYLLYVAMLETQCFASRLMGSQWVRY